MELLKPLAVAHVGLSAGHILDVTRIDQVDNEAPLFKNLEQRDPIHAGGLHRDRVHLTVLQPLRKGQVVLGEAAETSDRLLITVGGHRHPVFFRTDIDAGGVGMDHFLHASRSLLPGHRATPLSVHPTDRRNALEPGEVVDDNLPNGIGSEPVTNATTANPRNHAVLRVRRHQRRIGLGCSGAPGHKAQDAPTTQVPFIHNPEAKPRGLSLSAKELTV